MCGLVGIAGKLDHKDKEAFKKLLIICSLRGEDSAGYINVDAGNRVKVNKAVGNPFELFETKEWDRLNLLGDKAIIGHTRKATVGGISKYTAHPFVSEHIHGVHNGTLQNWSKLFEADQFKVDSQALFHSIAYDGIEETFGKLKGAWATVFWNSEENTINFLRNDQRPLWFATDKDAKKLYWASETWMLRMLSVQCGVEFYEDENHHIFHALKLDTLQRFEINPKDNKPLNVKPEREVKGDVTVYTVPTPFQGGRTPYTDNRPLEQRPWDNPDLAYCNKMRAHVPKHQAMNWKGELLHPLVPVTTQLPVIGVAARTSGQEENTNTSTTTKNVVVTPKPSIDSSTKSSSSRRPTLSLVQTPNDANSSDSNDSVGKKESLPTIDLPHEVLGPDGKEIDKERFHMLTASTCCFCSSPVDFDAIPVEGGKFIGNDSFLCGACLDDDVSLASMCSGGC